MRVLRSLLLVSLFLFAAFMLGGCVPVGPPLGRPIPLGVALSCLTPLAILLILALIAGLIIYIARNWSSGAKPSEPAAKEIARKRYAGGEITYEEYQEILRHLDETRTGRSA